MSVANIGMQIPYITAPFLAVPLYNSIGFRYMCLTIGPLCTLYAPFTDLTSSDAAYDAFSEAFIDLYNIYFPFNYDNRSGSSAKRIPRKPWITPVILKSINRKQRLYRKYIGHPTTSNKESYITYRILTTLIRKSKKSYYTDKLDACKHDTKRT